MTSPHPVGVGSAARVSILPPPVGIMRDEEMIMETKEKKEDKKQDEREERLLAERELLALGWQILQEEEERERVEEDLRAEGWVK